MPYEEVTLFSGNYVVDITKGWYNEFVAVYTVPSSPDTLRELINAKRIDRIPKILRVQLAYRIEYIDKMPLTMWGYSIALVDCNGEERVVRETTSFWNSSVDEGMIDVSNLYNCTAPSLGINAAKLRLLVPKTITIPSMPLPVARYNVNIRVAWSWGW